MTFAVTNSARMTVSNRMRLTRCLGRSYTQIRTRKLSFAATLDAADIEAVAKRRYEASSLGPHQAPASFLRTSESESRLRPLPSPNKRVMMAKCWDFSQQIVRVNSD